MGGGMSDDREWLTEAACAGKPTEWFFPPHWKQKAIDRAVAICMDCPVRIDCLKDALTEEGGHTWKVSGIRGGLSEEQRRRVLSKRRRQRLARRAS